MNEPCWLCDIRPIESKKRPLCMLCYRRCHERHLLHIFPLFKSANITKKKAVEKFGKFFVVDLEILRSGETTLRAVGEKYGVSRERIRQLYNIFFEEKYTMTVEERAKRLKLTAMKEDAEKQKFENRMNRAKKHCTTYTGIIAENLFREKCKSLGYDVEMQRGHFVFDAKVNGIAIDIKCGSNARRTSPESKQRYYNFNTTDKQREAVKYFPFYLIDEDSWYILPASVISKTAFHIPKYDITHGKFHKYRDIQQYREAWHLLK
jgi:hypothetical protein